MENFIFCAVAGVKYVWNNVLNLMLILSVIRNKEPAQLVFIFSKSTLDFEKAEAATQRCS